MNLTPPGNPAPAPARPSFSFRNVLLLLAPVVIGLAFYAGWYYRSQFNQPPIDYARLLRGQLVNPLKLDAAYTDADGDLVADPPTDRAKLADPAELVFAPLGPDLDREVWQDFVTHLAKTTGKEVTFGEPTESGPDALESMKGGRLHVAGFSTGAVPAAVNAAGFVPAVVMADADGKFGYEMEILVPADSPIQAPADLRGQALGVTRFTSLSSFKAPVMLLWKEHGMVPGRDYLYVHGDSQDVLIQGVAQKRFQAAAVANDLLRRVEARGDVSVQKIRSIYKSATYPPACFGHAHDLAPALAGKVREAFTSFKWDGTSLAKAYASANQSRFVPIHYREHWKAVRDTDAELARFGE